MLFVINFIIIFRCKLIYVCNVKIVITFIQITSD
ncbi:hypothetical protein KYT91_1880 (plasmid) [Klebsiella pneumoniae]|uniref:Uncharacterized protein n=1 Tax=Klebsiella pneumoniae subsp. pneumoniae TaxID=72407 RepID=A0A8F7PWW2_KLEPN|nr:hypothetical protein [Klebsiella pneumoniae subsp. pneumoniae]QXV91481.1 hypothetical protein [Klebsiella pneumoniae subsp. pneumoniae]UFX82489.1 hypothetical protein KYT91_1880 [Klebsiella pneumoniae]